MVNKDFHYNDIFKLDRASRGFSATAGSLLLRTNYCLLFAFMIIILIFFTDKCCTSLYSKCEFMPEHS